MSSSQPETVDQNVSGGGNVGDTTINTGDALSVASAGTSGNLNQNIDPQENSSQVVENSSNGSGSDNSAAVQETGSNDLSQQNSAVVDNALRSSAITGSNTSSDNVGNTKIATGDANVAGSSIAGLNTNLAGVSVSEFNVSDNQTGDLVLDFGANCVLGCSPAMVAAANSGNGSLSTNDATINNISSNDVNQSNNASLGNNMVLTADSGSNRASANTGGDTLITTGDANIDANAVSLLNNNIAGSVLLGFVNIFGKLIGDIILPESVLQCESDCQAALLAANSGNGAGSQNTAEIDTNTNTTITQSNNADILNNLDLLANTGDNQTSNNTGGTASLKTGNVSLDSRVLNIINSNLTGGSWWLVIVNKAGQWVGQIFGIPGTDMAGSQGTQFVEGASGEITAINSNNGTDSNNNAEISQNQNTEVSQENNARLVNNLSLNANTGNNRANDNTGGNTAITTGDAKIIANLVNFVNNNIIGGGRLVVSVVNVFGSWFGDFIAPGHKKPSSGSQANNSSPSQNSPSQNSGSSASSEASRGDSPHSQTLSLNVSSQTSPKPSSPSGQNSINFNLPLLVSGFKNDSPSVLSMDLPKNKEKSAKNLRLNLAWLLLIFPAGAAGYFIKKRMNRS